MPTIVAQDFAGETDQLTLTTPDASVPHEVDETRIRLLVKNLVDNALRHTPGGGNVVLSARRESDATVSVAVADTGPGIPESAIPHLFDRFYRSDRPGAEGGTGLGLAIARELTRAQHGEVQVESTENSGTTFRVLLRVYEAATYARRGRSGP